jgi:hypothetical protein
MKQLYPPADVEPEPPGDEGNRPKPAPFGKRRPSHGAMFGGPGERPPKGKVRQLYPPPPEPSPESGSHERATFERPQFELERDDVSSNIEIDAGYDETGTPFETTVVTAAQDLWLEPSFEPEVPETGAAGRDDSLFIATEEELEERRRRARERAEQRRRDELGE